MARKRYKIISEDLQKSLVDFLDEIQFDAAGNINDKESMQIVNFCNWAINELLNSFDGYVKESSDDKKKPNKKSRDQYVDETFMDWNLPEMSDEDYEKLVDQFDAFLRGWEKEYNKNNPKKKIDERPQKGTQLNTVVEYMSLEEIEEMLKEDPELTDSERFELYYDERERRKEEDTGLTYEELLKAANIKPPKKK